MAIDPTTIYSDTSVPAPSGQQFLDQYDTFVSALINAAVLRLTGVGGTADNITATAEPFEVPPSGLVAGMKFVLRPTANNTGPVTLDIDGRGAQPVVDRAGTTLEASDLVAGTDYLLRFDGSGFRVLTQTGEDISGIVTEVFTTTGVWENVYAPDAIVEFRGWGGGGGGSTNQRGGGGGAYVRKQWRAGDLPATVTVSVAAGGAADANGGNTSFGALATAYGGARGAEPGNNGRGGGEHEAGADGGLIGGGFRDSGDVADGVTVNADDGHAKTPDGGGGGGLSSAGGDAVNGGAGGGGYKTAGSPFDGGRSVHGGTGGQGGAGTDPAGPGQTPGGGGGSGDTVARSAGGGDGQAIVRVYQ